MTKRSIITIGAALLAGLATTPTAEANPERFLELGYRILNTNHPHGPSHHDRRYHSGHDCHRHPHYYRRPFHYDDHGCKKKAKKRHDYYEKLEKERRKHAKEWRKKREKLAKKYYKHHGSCHRH